MTLIEKLIYFCYSKISVVHRAYILDLESKNFAPEFAHTYSSKVLAAVTKEFI